jgi:hypothetical protein
VNEACSERGKSPLSQWCGWVNADRDECVSMSWLTKYRSPSFRYYSGLSVALSCILSRRSEIIMSPWWKKVRWSAFLRLHVIRLDLRSTIISLLFHRNTKHRVVHIVEVQGVELSPQEKIEGRWWSSQVRTNVNASTEDICFLPFAHSVIITIEQLRSQLLLEEVSRRLKRKPFNFNSEVKFVCHP